MNTTGVMVFKKEKRSVITKSAIHASSIHIYIFFVLHLIVIIELLQYTIQFFILEHFEMGTWLKISVLNKKK